MNQKEIIEEVAEFTGHPPSVCKEVMDNFLAIIQSQVAAGARIRLKGFGTFECHTTLTKRHYHPVTRELIPSTQQIKPRFVPGKNFLVEVRMHTLDDTKNGRP